MWKWLRSWFAWRFSLVRLVVCIVFLAACIGLNFREIMPPPRGVEPVYYGWPLPCTVKWDVDLVPNARALEHFLFDEGKHARWLTTRSHLLPLTHQTYRLIEFKSLRWFYSQNGLIVCGILNGLFGLAVLFPILFLQLPRRKVAAKGV
jgi:hypothetical protein